MFIIIKWSSPDFITENLNKTDNENFFQNLKSKKMFGVFFEH